MNIIKSLRTSLMLLGFGPPFKLPEKTLYIDKIGVLEKYRGKGLGKKLINHAFNIATQEDIQFVELEVTAKNQNAISLYEKIGFKIIKSTKITLGRIFVGVSKYYRMRKKLNKTNDKD